MGRRRLVQVLPETAALPHQNHLSGELRHVEVPIEKVDYRYSARGDGRMEAYQGGIGMDSQEEHLEGRDRSRILRPTLRFPRDRWRRLVDDPRHRRVVDPEARRDR